MEAKFKKMFSPERSDKFVLAVMDEGVGISCKDL